MAGQVAKLIEELQQLLTHTLTALDRFDDEALDDPSRPGEILRDLLNDVIEEDRIQTGNLIAARSRLKARQTGEMHRLMAETLRARADLIATLIGLPDDLAEMSIADQPRTIQAAVQDALDRQRGVLNALAERANSGRRRDS